MAPIQWWNGIVVSLSLSFLSSSMERVRARALRVKQKLILLRAQLYITPLSIPDSILLKPSVR